MISYPYGMSYFKGKGNLEKEMGWLLTVLMRFYPLTALDVHKDLTVLMAMID